MPEKNPSIKLNMMMNVLLAASSVIFPLITLPYVTRVLGPDGVGRVYFASSVITFFAVFAEMGIPVYGIRACARVRDDRRELSETVQEIVLINLATCFIVYAVLFVLLFTVPRFSGDRLMMIIMSSGIILNAIGVEWLYKALEKYRYITIRSVVFKLAALILMFMMVRDGSDYVIYGCLTIFAAGASNILNFINLRKYVEFRPAGVYDFRKHISPMITLFALSAAVAVYTNLDTAILGLLKGNAEVALYGVSVRIKLVLVRMITSVSEVLLPRTSFYYAKGRKDEAEGILAGTMDLVLTLSVPAAVYFMIYSGECIRFLAGDGFAGAALCMRIIMPAVVLVGASNIIGMQKLMPSGKEKEVMISAMLGAAVDLALNFALIPSFASAGAAAATLTAEICVLLYLLSRVGRGERRELFGRVRFVWILLYTGISSAACLSVRLLHAGVFLTLCLSAAVFFGIYAALAAYRWKSDGLLR